MGSVVLDEIRINSYVLPNLRGLESKFQSAYSIASSLKRNLPSSYNNRYLVNQISSDIYDYKIKLQNINKLIEDKLNTAKKIESSSNNKVLSIASKFGSLSGAIGGSKMGKNKRGIYYAFAS